MFPNPMNPIGFLAAAEKEAESGRGSLVARDTCVARQRLLADNIFQIVDRQPDQWLSVMQSSGIQRNH